jgi:hypothetical protein
MRYPLASVLTLSFGLALGNISPALAQNEAQGPVPARTNPNDPGSEVYRATNVIGMPVRDKAGNEVGHIKDLVINGQTREVLFAVLEMNGAPEGDVVYVMPWTVFQPFYGQAQTVQYVVLGLPPNVIVQGPRFRWTQWQQIPFTTWAPQVNAYFARVAPAAVGVGVGAGVGVGRNGITAPRGTAPRQNAPAPQNQFAPHPPRARNANTPPARDPRNPVNPNQANPPKAKNPNAPQGDNPPASIDDSKAPDAEDANPVKPAPKPNPVKPAPKSNDDSSADNDDDASQPAQPSVNDKNSPPQDSSSKDSKDSKDSNPPANKPAPKDD